ncbi:UNVERIFIED_CONTAM: hypothetical protein HDU68_006705 [Siphonaria sp. JEL0065]|nr:hypothetical protein HDU68_006705 [Siphonaria sp. JEL0065]
MKGLNFRNWTRRRNNTVAISGSAGSSSTLNELAAVKPPPPSLPGIRRFSLAGSSGTNLQLLGLTDAPVIPVAAFEIVPGAEDSDGEDDSANGQHNENHNQQSELQNDGNNNSLGSNDENTGKTNITNLTSNAPSFSNGLLALAAILQRRRGSSATVSSWMEDQSIYDEAEVRSALPCLAISNDNETSSLEVLQKPAFGPPLDESTPLLSMSTTTGTPIVSPNTVSLAPIFPKRVIVIALDTFDANPLQWTLANTILHPQRDLVVVLNVRPDVVISSAVLEQTAGGEGILGKIEDENKKTSHGFLKNQIQVLTSHEILAKGLALRGDPRHGIIKTLRELDADMLILGPHHEHHAQRLWISSSQYQQLSSNATGLGLGSVSDYVLRNASCSVLIAKEKVAAGASATAA